MKAPVINHNNEIAKTWSNKQVSLAAYAAERHIPLAGAFELTPRCNFGCKMCYVHLQESEIAQAGTELTTSDWIELGKQAAANGTLHLLITGGEPLLREDFEEIYTFLCKMGFILALNTNATVLSDSLIRLLSKYPPTSINVTIYGASAETYEKVCGNGSGFESMKRGLKKLSTLPASLKCRMTVIKDNMMEYNQVREIANKFTKQFAIDTMIIQSNRVPCSGAEACRMSPEQRAILEEENRKKYTNIFEVSQGLDDSKTLNTNYIAPNVLYCYAAKSSYWIAWDGKMLPCATFSTPYTDPLKEGFLAAWNRLPNLLSNISRPTECNNCIYDGYCPNCIANLQAETGEYDKISQYICSIGKMRYEALQRE